VGRVFWSYCSPIGVNPQAEEILDALERLPSQATLERKRTMAALRVPVWPTDHIRGNAAAPVTLLEYGDYECPACGLAHQIVTRVREHFGENLRFVFRHFPLTEIHPSAEPAAETAEFAGAQGRFWEMHDNIYRNQIRLGEPLLFGIARAFQLSETRLREALVNHTHAPKVQSDFLGGVRSGVNGTPTFFVNGVRHDAPFDFQTLVVAIDYVLHRRSPQAQAHVRTG
jgi:protein-disulfide isomerase